MRSLYEEPEPRRAAVEWPALEAIDVFRIYRSGPVETVALRGLDLRVERGEMVALLGPSGSGKSTLLLLAAAMDQPSAGELRVAGRSLTRLADAELAAVRARAVAVVFQSDNLWPALSAVENVATSLRLAGVEEPTGAAEEALRGFGLGARLRHRPAALSGGEQQRVAIAAAAARRAPLVLADEPTAELDATSERIVLDALRTLRDEYGSSLLVVTHSDRVAAVADRVVQVRDGRVAA